MRESQIEKYLINRVVQLGGEVRKVKWLGRRGAPDRLVMLPARRVTEPCGCCSYTEDSQTIWVELKAPGKGPEPHQEREHERMRRMGQRVEVVDSIEGVEALLQ